MKRVFITGSSKGIGYDIARKFVDSKKYFVNLNSRSKNANINKILNVKTQLILSAMLKKLKM